MIPKNIKIYITGHKGMVGNACLKMFNKNGYKNIIKKTSNELDLKNQYEVEKFISKEKPDIIINAAAKVGGIVANDSWPYEFIMDNMLIQNNIIHSSYKNNIKKLIFLGSSCIYPKFSKQPIKEEYLLNGSLESTNEWYAIAKISGIKSIEALNKQFNRKYVALMPTNLYGPNDNFSTDTSHVLPAMIRKFHDSKLKNNSDVILWGTGEPKREFLHVEDLSKAILYAVENNLEEHLYNIGTGSDISIYELSKLVQNVIGHKGRIIWDKTKPNGTPRKLLDCSKINNLGWNSKIKLKEGIKDTYNWFLKNQSNFRNVEF